uniref:TFIIB-type zinc ribbon-containing protein n=1 Tax=Caldiarchaeum subterraneum TaxID=311458 RepID=A0A7C5U5L0_CALS0
MALCFECGASLVYDRETRTYTCTGCGGTYTSQDLLIDREKRFNSKFKEDRKRKKREEYLEWWLSSKS